MRVVGNADLGSTSMIGLRAIIFNVNFMAFISHCTERFYFSFAWFLHAFQSKRKEMKPRQDNLQDKSRIEKL